MFPFYQKKPKPKVVIIPEKINVSKPLNQSSKPQVKIPYHFQKNSIITYSQSQIKRELKKYPGLLRTLGHAYQYQIIFNNEDQEKQYWFCRNLELVMPLLKYLNEQNWIVDWHEKPFKIMDSSFDYPITNSTIS
ncbi:hypothetical protein GM3708_2774 [Geminocystis sp. NIES-3708]|uniref:hypothetical protein n=1 Tax=Geminocystis sp. NIES-3708 TaxID=1615909 RepID=UPI0005FCD843|nr:hypothetical protein [Geminocystis sp. NIES-3708]BAQ62368.1 hypothetical protein GM3708_2774 [Geminocystis sp. NIES-3708]